MMVTGVALMAAGALLATAAITYLAVTLWRRDTARRAALVPRTVTVALAGDYLPVLRIDGAPFGDAPPPPNVPGRGTPAPLTAPMPPISVAAVPDAAPAGGSSPPAGDTRPPGAHSLPEGNANLDTRSPQEAPAPGDPQLDYKPREPFWYHLSDDTIARGIPAVK